MDDQKMSRLKENAKAADEAQGQFMEPEPPKKDPRGRKKLSDAEKAEAKARREAQKKAATGQAGAPAPDMGFQIPTKAITIPIASSISVLGVQYAGHPDAALVGDELDNMATALGMVMDKYIPNIAGKYGPELYLGLCLSQYGIRVMQIRKAVQAHKEKTEAKKSDENAKIKEYAETRPQFQTEALPTQ